VAGSSAISCASIGAPGRPLREAFREDNSALNPDRVEIFLRAAARAMR